MSTQLQPKRRDICWPGLSLWLPRLIGSMQLGELAPGVTRGPRRKSPHRRRMLDLQQDRHAGATNTRPARVLLGHAPGQRFRAGQATLSGRRHRHRLRQGQRAAGGGVDAQTRASAQETANTVTLFPGLAIGSIMAGSESS